jgi:dimethylamine monooxygenase subunit A
MAIHAPWEEAADFAIGLRPIAPADWLEGGEAEPAARKDDLLAAHPQLVWAETEGSTPAQAEVLALVEAAVGARADRRALPPLLSAARLVADDLVLMAPEAGQWRLAALSLCAPTFFSAEEVIGKSLAELHGPVPGFEARLLGRVARIFDGLRPELILERRNWTLVNSDLLFAPEAAPIRARIPAIAPHEAGRTLFLRVERQTLRRLPRSGGALFTIRVWLRPLAELAADPARLAGFAAAWRGASADFRAYKKLHLYDDLVEAFLRAAGESGAHGPA